MSDTWQPAYGASYFDMRFFYRRPDPLDPLSDETFERWLCARDGRTLEEFAADGGVATEGQRDA